MPSDSAGLVSPPAGGGGLSLGSDSAAPSSGSKKKTTLLIGGGIVAAIAVYIYAKNKASGSSSGSSGSTTSEPEIITPSSDDDSQLGDVLSTIAANQAEQGQVAQTALTATAPGALSQGGFLPGGVTTQQIMDNPGTDSAIGAIAGSGLEQVFTWLTPGQYGAASANGQTTYIDPTPGTFIPTPAGTDTTPGQNLTPIYGLGGITPTTPAPAST